MFFQMLKILIIFMAIGSSKFGFSFDIVQNTVLMCEILIVALSSCTIICAVVIKNSSMKLSSVIPAVAVYGTSPFIFHIISILYGAPITISFSETFHFAWLLSTMTALPALTVVGANAEEWIRVLFLNKAENNSETSLQWSCYGALVGAWLGALPIPLDWDRPWQEWPTSSLIGCLLGYMMGLIIGISRVYLNSQKSHKMKYRNA